MKMQNKYRKALRKWNGWVLSAIVLGVLMLLLTGCSKAHFNVAPDVQEYSKADQRKAAAEIRGGGCPVISGMMGDYLIMRDQSRALK